MSSHDSTTSRIQACSLAVRSALPTLHAMEADMAAGLQSAGLTQTAAAITATTPVSEVQHAWTELPTGWLQAAPAPVADAWAAACTALAAAAPDAAWLAQDALTAAAGFVGTVEQEVAATATELALLDMGGSLRVWDHDGRTILERRAGHEVLVVAVGPGMVIESDHAGLDGVSCLDRQGELEDGQRRHGLQVTTTSRDLHGDRRGGELIAEVSQQAHPAARTTVAGRATGSLHTPAGTSRAGHRTRA